MQGACWHHNQRKAFQKRSLGQALIRKLSSVALLFDTSIQLCDHNNMHF